MGEVVPVEGGGVLAVVGGGVLVLVVWGGEGLAWREAEPRRTRPHEPPEVRDSPGRTPPARGARGGLVGLGK